VRSCRSLTSPTSPVAGTSKSPASTYSPTSATSASKTSHRRGLRVAEQEGHVNRDAHGHAGAQARRSRHAVLGRAKDERVAPNHSLTPTCRRRAPQASRRPGPATRCLRFRMGPRLARRSCVHVDGWHTSWAEPLQSTREGDDPRCARPRTHPSQDATLSRVTSDRRRRPA